MIKQIIKMVWNQRRNYCGILIEQFLIGFILMLCLVSVTEAIKKYKDPGILETNNVLAFGYMIQNNNRNPNIANDAGKSMKVISDNLKKLPFVEYIANTGNLAPYLRSNESYQSDSILVDEKRLQTVIKSSDEYGAFVLNPEMEEGNWLSNHPLEDGSDPMVITRQFADKAGWTSVIGKKVNLYSRTYTVVGMVAGLKQQPFELSPVAIVVPTYVRSGSSSYSEYIVKVKNGEQAAFYDAYNKEFRRLIPDNNIEPFINDLRIKKEISMLNATVDIVLQAIPTLFLLIFAFIGAFGLYWLYSRKRQKEFAVRIAVGSTQRQLISIVVLESLLVTTIAIIPVLLLAFFIYEYTPVHVVATSTLTMVMLLFSAISAGYPAWKAAQVNPAIALQYE
jgi:ABC-type antimicrobial peptide transport system permease subunit